MAKKKRGRPKGSTAINMAIRRMRKIDPTEFVGRGRPRKHFNKIFGKWVPGGRGRPPKNSNYNPAKKGYNSRNKTAFTNVRGKLIGYLYKA